MNSLAPKFTERFPIFRKSIHDQTPAASGKQTMIENDSATPSISIAGRERQKLTVGRSARLTNHFERFRFAIPLDWVNSHKAQQSTHAEAITAWGRVKN